MAQIFKEKFDINRLNWLLHSFKIEHLQAFYSDNKTTKSEIKSTYNILMTYIRQKHDAPDNDKAVYDFVKGRTDGRKYGDKTIQSIKKQIRGFLCSGLTTDIDMENAHPMILYHLCTKYKIHCFNLATYCKNREDCLKQITQDLNISREKAKKLLLTSTNMGKPIKTKSAFVKAYDAEMKTIHTKLLDVEDYQYLKEFANEDKQNYNGILCVEENKILEVMEEFLVANVARVTVFHDYRVD